MEAEPIHKLFTSKTLIRYDFENTCKHGYSQIIIIYLDYKGDYSRYHFYMQRCYEGDECESIILLEAIEDAQNYYFMV
jgi:hypothetical protein